MGTTIRAVLTFVYLLLFLLHSIFSGGCAQQKQVIKCEVSAPIEATDRAVAKIGYEVEWK
jgi:hypothetical protein